MTTQARSSLRRACTGRKGLAGTLVLAVFCAAAALASTGLRSGAAGAAPLAVRAFPVDHFACYPARFTAFKRRRVQLENQFGSTPAIVEAPTRLCAPADKNGEGLVDRRAHLVCYGLSRTQSPRPGAVVSVKNQLGTIRLSVVIDPPEALCLPSSKSLEGPPRDVPKRLDHFLCYRVDPAGRFEQRRVTIADQFGKSEDTVLTPRSLCVPTSKNRAPIVQPRVHLLCYEVKSGTKARRFAIRNQFGPLRGAGRQRDRLCVPSTKKVISLQPPAPGSGRLKTAIVAPSRSARYAPFRVPPEVERNSVPPRVIPTGATRGSLSPGNDSSSVRPAPKPNGATSPDRSSAVTFFRNTSFQSRVAFSGVPPDMSGADNGNVVLTTGNTFAAFSTNAGGSFTALDPTTIFPSGPSRDATGVLLDNGLCCDQIIQYVPSIDRFIWLMQFCGSGANCLQGRNKLRIASASSADVAAGATSWTYWDLTSGLFGLASPNDNMDYPDLAVGNNFLYLSVDNVNVGLLVMRIPLREIAASATINIGFTTPSDSATAYGGHLTQNVAETGYWAGHVDNSTMRIFSLREGEGFYSWRDVRINTWCNGDRSSLTPGGTNDWLAFGFPGNAVHGSTERGGERTRELWFSWTAGHKLASGQSCGFDQSHVEIVVLNKSTFAVVGQMQVWNPTIAFAYAALATNGRNEVGMSLGYGGGGNEANHAVGFWGDFVVYSTTSSTSSINRFGDYVAIRRSSPAPERFSAVGYGTNPGFDPHYVQFGR